MKTLEQVLTTAAQSHGVNLLFDTAMYSLMADLERIVTVLREAGIPFAVVGGVAVSAHILEEKRSRSFVTRNVDLLVRREDLAALVSAAEAAGYTGRRILGGFALLRPRQDPGEAVHLLFAGERPRPTHPLPNPDIAPVEKDLAQFGLTIPVAALKDVVRMKLNSLRPKDQAHLEILERCGLITAEVKAALPPILRERLVLARASFEPDEFEEI